MPENKCAEACPLIPRVEALERANEQHSSTHREIFNRLNSVERDNAVQDAHYRAIDAKLEELAGKAGKRWESIVDKAIWAVAAAVIAFLLAKVGL